MLWILFAATVGVVLPTAAFAQDTVSSFTFFLRKDVPDIRLLSSITPTAKAAGAEGSFTVDKTSHDRIWAANGIAGVAWKVLSNEALTSDTFLGLHIAPYVGINRISHSNPKLASKNADTLTSGLKMEVGYSAAGGHHYLRTGGAVVSDQIQDTTAGAFVAEWLPVYEIFLGRIPYAFTYLFQPSLKAQFDSTGDDKNPLLFSNQQNALRLGPEVSLNISPDTDSNSFLSRFVGNVTYLAWRETYSDRAASWLSASITYNIDPKGNFGLTTSYKKGSDEDTGKTTDLLKVALSGKF
jgi:hypothetical protein